MRWKFGVHSHYNAQDPLYGATSIQILFVLLANWFISLDKRFNINLFKSILENILFKTTILRGETSNFNQAKKIIFLKIIMRTKINMELFSYLSWEEKL